jgi:hypothetical protein
MNFEKFQKSVIEQFDRMQRYPLFRVQVEKDVLWQKYLDSFPPGTNPKFKERTEFDCQICKNFVRAVGGVVAVVDGKIATLWDNQVDGFYNDVSQAMSEFVKSKPIDNIFLHTEGAAGSMLTRQQTPNGVVSWNHFYIAIPRANICEGDSIGTRLGESRSSRDVFARSLTELRIDAIDIVLELISQNSLYRGEEHKFALEAFRKFKVEFDKIKGETKRDIYVWSQVKAAPGSVVRFRNTVIGTLVSDLSDGKELEDAVKAFEAKVAPTNYKRPTALVTKAMIEKAQKEVEKLGLKTALERRFATIDDIKINNVLFANRDAKKALGGDVFDDLKATVAEKIQNFDKVEEIGIDKFIEEVLPKAESIEIMFENKQASNLVSLIAPVDKEAKEMFKWQNPFSWSYTGDVADSIKERVKKAGGKVDGDLRCSLSWFNHDDLDLHMIEQPNHYEIYFGNRGRQSPSGGMLDVDMNAGAGDTRTPVENITYADRRTMKKGFYNLFVHNYCRRETTDVGFEVEIEFDGKIQTISYAKAVQNGEQIQVARLQYSKKDGFKIVESLPSTATSKEVWGVKTQAFHKVSAVMLSPNYWDDKPVGNKHYFFMLEGCKNEGKARGFFNEFLTPELDAHRKVLEVVGSKVKTEESDRQLSGLGFSSTQRNSILCRVKGNFSRVLKINI